MKKILILALLAISAFSSSNAQIVNAYAEGHAQGINQIQREFELQGYKNEKVEFKKYIVALDIKNIPKNKILLIKNYAFFDGLLPLTVKTNKNKSLIVFSSFDREVDARNLSENLNKKIPLDKNYPKIITILNKNMTFRKEPFIYKWIYDKMLKDIKNSVKGKVYIIKEKVPSKPIIKKSKEEINKFIKPKVEASTSKTVTKTKKSKLLIKNYRVKYESPLFYYSDKFLKYKSRKWKDEKFIEKGTAKKGDIIKSANIVVTEYGDKYVKILNKNLFIELDNVEKVK